MHSNDEIERAAARAEELAPTGVPVDDTSDLHTLAEAVDAAAPARLAFMSWLHARAPTVHSIPTN
jgi:hypothetical protein